MTSSAITIGRGLSGARWRLQTCDEAFLKVLAQETVEDELLLRCLLHRGIATAADVRNFLSPQFPGHLHDPGLLRDMASAVARLREAVVRRERIMIVTDFDVDGTTSSVILSTAIRLIGGGDLITSYIPDRFTEGYGLSRRIVELAAEQGFRVILTADIGIKSHAEARLARELGVDLIICDHHLPDGEDVPADAFAVLCPKGSSGTDYPNKHLAACGVALKLADALLEGNPRRELMLESLAKLAAIGSIADMVDLSTNENRAIITRGLAALGNGNRNHGLRALLAVSKAGNPPTTYDVGFKIGPRINAAGRITHADAVLKLFAASSEEEANTLAGRLDALNSERRQVQETLVTRLLKTIEAAETSLDRVLVFAGSEADGFHRGVVGIACSKIVERYGRPTLICAINEEGQGHGSARSIQGFHIVEALDSIADLMTKYGGHPMAAGFTIAGDQIDEFRRRLNEYAVGILSDEDLGPRETADAELNIDQVCVELVRSLARLEPHGIGNPRPQFLLRDVPLRGVQLLKDTHLKFLLGTGRTTVEALWWNEGKHFEEFRGARTVSLMCRPEVNTWNGIERCQIRVKDAAVGTRT